MLSASGQGLRRCASAREEETLTPFICLRNDEIMNSRLLLSLWLAFALLFAQQGAALHALSHFADGVPAQSQQEKHLPHSPACDKCVAYAGIGGAASPSPPVFATQETTVILAAVFFLLFFSAPLRTYLSRAPPRLN